MLNCPHNGICAKCQYVRSMAVGGNQRDRVFSCSRFSSAPLTMLGYDGKQGNRPVPVEPLTDTCFSTDKQNDVTGGWFN